MAVLIRNLMLAMALLIGVAACASAPAESLSADTVVIDVRTPAEFAEGHLAGAVNINLQSGSFEQQIATLPLDGEYVVYCRSGNRSGQAVAAMTSLGFENVVDAGGMEAAAESTGLSVVTE